MPGLSDGVRMLRMKSPKSQTMTDVLITKPAVLFKMPILHVVTLAVSLDVMKCVEDQEMRLEAGMPSLTADRPVRKARQHQISESAAAMEHDQ